MPSLFLRVWPILTIASCGFASHNHIEILSPWKCFLSKEIHFLLIEDDTGDDDGANLSYPVAHVDDSAVDKNALAVEWLSYQAEHLGEGALSILCLQEIMVRLFADWSPSSFAKPRWIWDASFEQTAKQKKEAKKKFKQFLSLTAISSENGSHLKGNLVLGLSQQWFIHVCWQRPF